MRPCARESISEGGANGVVMCRGADKELQKYATEINTLDATRVTAVSALEEGDRVRIVGVLISPTGISGFGAIFVPKMKPDPQVTLRVRHCLCDRNNGVMSDAFDERSVKCSPYINPRRLSVNYVASPSNEKRCGHEPRRATPVRRR
jgi:hypothetical protein